MPFQHLEFWFFLIFLDNSESGRNYPGSSDGFFLLIFGRIIPVVTLKNPIRLEFLVDPSAALVKLSFFNIWNSGFSRYFSISQNQGEIVKDPIMGFSSRYLAEFVLM